MQIVAMAKNPTDSLPTAQPFTPEAMHQIWHYLQGQPWLVNALAHEVVYKMRENRDRSVTITAPMIHEAKECLILHCDTHLDQLTDKPRAPRVRCIIEPILAGETAEDLPPDDMQYVIDLGLICKLLGNAIAIANLIYKEIILRDLTDNTQISIPHEFQPIWRTPDGKLDASKLLDAFLAFWCEHGQSLLRSVHYTEIAPHNVKFKIENRYTCYVNQYSFRQTLKHNCIT